MDRDDGVNDFLARVKELGAQRDREDEERTRQLEEEILAGRQARQSRRAERAKSLSPLKDSPSRNSRVFDSIDLRYLRNLDSNAPNSREEAVNDALDKLTGISGPASESTGAMEAPPTLPWQRRPESPWQRRPESRGSVSPDAPTKADSSTNSEFRRSQIARNLESKDISFFQQTSDRKISPDVLLKNMDEGMGNSAKKALPGMSSSSNRSEPPVTSTQEPTKRSTPNHVRSHKSSPSMNSSGFPTLSKSNLLPTSSAMRFDPAGKDSGAYDDEIRRPAMSPSQSRIDPDWKPPNPNKTVGSFVQSAMLKREGSISKRWSATLPGGIARGGSPVSAADRISAFENRALPKPGSRESSPGTEKSSSPSEPTRKEALNRGRAKSIVESLSKYSTSGIMPVEKESPKREVTPPATPSSKPFDQKRWSPTKTSWLEVALKKGSETSSPVLSKNTPVLEPTVRPTDNRPAPLPKPANLPSRSALESASNISHTSAALNQVTSSFPKGMLDKPPVLEKPVPLVAAKKLPPPVAEKPSSITVKPVPGPKVELDFRGNLKHRSSPSGSPDKEDLPFLSAMSRLRSTKTQNYMPPNEFKETILARKAALQETGPPKPKSPDPVKERLLSAKGALRHSNSTTSNISTSSSQFGTKPKPPPPSKLASALGRIELESKVEIKQEPTTVSIQSITDKRIPNLANLLARGPPSHDKPQNISGTTTSGAHASSAVGEDSQRESKDVDRPLTHMTKSRSRGPKRRQPTKAPVATHEEAPTKPPNTKSSLEFIHTPQPQLPPLRPKPSREVLNPPQPLKPKPSREILNPPQPLRSKLSKEIINATQLSSGAKPMPIAPPKPDFLEQNPELTAPDVAAEIEIPKAKPPTPAKPSIAVDEPDRIKAKPTPPAKSPLLLAKTDFKPSPNSTPVPSPSIEKSGFSLDAQSGIAKSPSIAVSDPPPVERPVQPPALGWLARKNTSARASSGRYNPKAQQEGKTNEHSSLASNTYMQPRLPPRPIVEDEEDESEVKPKSLGPAPIVPNHKVRVDLVSDTGIRKVSYGSIPNHANQLNEFFKEPELPTIKLNLDMTQFLPSRTPEYEKVKTVKLDVWEVSVDGKVQTVPAGNEHILFDENMYMCLHIFERNSGQKDAEFFLWSGSQVSPATVEDAQIFAKKMANENEASMSLVQQGHETAAFLKALGGVLITRRGNSKSGGAGQYMLCGRRLFSGVAFDEEDLRNSCLCSGFPFLIRSGQKLYLWKGSGATAQELDCARQIAADLAAGAEEVEEGDEPQALLNILQADGTDEKAAAKYWTRKPDHDNYVTRLFKCDTRSSQAVTELSPFCQRDIELTNIYVLDAFFELYIVIGAKSQSKRADFQTALQFTQEYAKAAHTTENRPFLPPTFVLLEGVSKEFRAVFRSWQADRIPTMWAPSRKPSLRIVEGKEAMRVMGVVE